LEVEKFRVFQTAHSGFGWGEGGGEEESRIETCAVPSGCFKKLNEQTGGFHERTSKRAVGIFVVSQ
jgi:hypothetical protein